MSPAPQPKLYTVEEARALVPWLRTLLTEMRAEKQMLDADMRALERLTPEMKTNGHAAEAARYEARINETVESIRQKLEEIAALDIEIKNIDSGLVDFLSLRNGEVVYLCWKVDEPTVEYWHPIDTGFRGRQSLDH